MNIAIVLAAGQGKRMSGNVKKQFIEIGEKPIVYYSLLSFQKNKEIDKIILVTGKEEINYCKAQIVDKYSLDKVVAIVEGGSERQNSVLNGLLKIKELADNSIIKGCDVVSIHDSARPMVTEEMIIRGIEGAKNCGAVTAAVKVKDTIKLVDNNNTVDKTLNRDSLWIIQTPQTFNFELIYKAHMYAKANNIAATDDCALVEAIGKKVKVIVGDYKNIKVTTPEDVEIIKVFLSE